MYLDTDLDSVACTPFYLNLWILNNYHNCLNVFKIHVNNYHIEFFRTSRALYYLGRRAQAPGPKGPPWVPKGPPKGPPWVLQGVPWVPKGPPWVLWGCPWLPKGPWVPWAHPGIPGDLPRIPKGPPGPPRGPGRPYGPKPGLLRCNSVRAPRLAEYSIQYDLK